MTQLKKPDDSVCPVLVLQSVIDEIRRHGKSSMNREVCGVLIGNLCLTEEDKWRVCVEGRIEGKYADNQLGSVTFTADTWDYIHDQLEKYYPNRRIVGWYHTHPGFGIFLSAMDVYIHSNFFSPHWQVAFVYDPQAETDGWFLWGDEKPEPATVQVCEGEPGPAPKIIIENPASTSADPTPGDTTMNTQPHTNPTPMGVMDYVMVGACALMMVLMILLLVRLDRNIAHMQERLSEVEKVAEDWNQHRDKVVNLPLGDVTPDQSAPEKKRPPQTIPQNPPRTRPRNPERPESGSRPQLKPVANDPAKNPAVAQDPDGKSETKPVQATTTPLPPQNPSDSTATDQSTPPPTKPDSADTRQQGTQQSTQPSATDKPPAVPPIQPAASGDEQVPADSVTPPTPSGGTQNE